MSRRFQNNWIPSLQSRFIEELDQNIIKTVNHASDHMNSLENESFDEFNQDLEFKPKKISHGSRDGVGYRTVLAMEDENIRDINDDIFLQIGQSVKHKKFGIGKIQDIDGSKVIVDFDKHGSKKLISDFLKPC